MALNEQQARERLNDGMRRCLRCKVRVRWINHRWVCACNGVTVESQSKTR